MSNYSLYIFNPENDLALAFGGENYTPPPLATKLRNDLELLPIWYASKNSFILLKNVYQEQWLRKLANNIDLSIKIITQNQLSTYQGRFSPWGWSLDTRKRLIDKGVDPSLLPDKEWLENIRKLSHRSISIQIQEKLGNNELVAVECNSLDDVREFSLRYPECFIKAPWSSSGKGIFRVLDRDAIDFKRWCSGIIKRQGSIICEKPLKGVLDFAMEFKVESNDVNFVGYSIFNNDNHCSFDNAIVASTEVLETIIVNYLDDKSILHEIRRNLISILKEIIGDKYEGYLGIDMMLYEESGKIKINPCIELNLRTTMGVVTSFIGNKFIEAGSKGIFKIKYYKESIDLHEEMNDIIKNNPPVYKNGKIIDGVQFLVPIEKHSRYCAYVDMRS